MLHKFSYIAPHNREELLELLADKKSSAKIIAGGTDLLVDIRAGNQTPEYLVDLKNFENYGEINFSIAKGLSIGANVTLIQLMERGFVNSDYPLIAKAASEIGSPQLRNRATAVGNICTASPASDLAIAFLALDSSLEISSVRGTRTVHMTEFFKGVKKTLLADDEIVENIIVPQESSGHKGSMLKMKRIKGHDLAVVSVACALVDNKIKFAAGSCSPTPLFIGEFSENENPEAIVEKTLSLVSPIDDIRASAEYRRFMLAEYVVRLFEEVKASK